MEMKKTELVMIPVPGIGHLTSTIEVAKLLTARADHFSIKVLIMKLPTDEISVPESSDSRLKFIQLRGEELPAAPSDPSRPPHMVFFEFIDSHKAHVREILAEIKNSSDSCDLGGIVVDMFCLSMMDLAIEFGIPSYLYFTSGAAMLGLVFHVQGMMDNFNVDVTAKYTDPDAVIDVPTYANPFPAKVLPPGITKREGLDLFLNQGRRFRETKGIIINTFLELETHAIRALSDDKTIPPVYPIGPLVKLQGSDHNQNSKNKEIVNWLDHQPDSSVVFLCFGSRGTFGDAQVKEIANALERIGYRFLWSLRKPQPRDKRLQLPEDYENLEEVLPEGFLKRTSEVGKVIGWAPQVAVLSHPAVGGFVSHCGWNSTLESIWCGVPMATWPLYAEQQANSFQLIEDLGLAVEIKMDYKKEFDIQTTEIVGADVIENGIKKLMDPENGIREKMKEMKQKSRLALTDGGSSSASLERFLKSVRNNSSIK